MLGELKKVQDKFYSNQSIEEFLKTRTIFQAIKLLNKSSKSQTKVRIRRFFSKITQSNYYKEYLSAGLVLEQQKQKKQEFMKYIKSDECEEYYELLHKKLLDVITLLDVDSELVPVFFSLVYGSNGIKMIKTVSQLYEKYGDNHDCLYTQQIREELKKGVKFEDDSVVQMRFIEIAANIATKGGKNFHFVQDILEQGLDFYKTEDILLKLNIVQIVSVMGQGVETSQLLRGHKIWGLVEKDAMDNQQEFYVRKCLLILLVGMAAHDQYQFNPRITKNIIEFLRECLTGSGEYLEAGIELCGYLFCFSDGAKILIQNNEVFTHFLKLARSTQDQVKNQYLISLGMLTDKTNGKKTKQIVMNILNCIGNPNLSGELSQNMNANNFMVAGIPPFCTWFSSFMILPFEEVQIKLIKVFQHLLGYMQICETLFEEQNVTKYLLKPIGASNSTKVLRQQKNLLVHEIIEKGEKQWKGTKLQAYSIMIQKELQREKMDVQYMTEAQ